jgi:hypothetical protein
MSYKEFSLAKVKKVFNLTTTEEVNVYANIPELDCSNLLTETLSYNVPLALSISTEKARSEMIVAPILIEVRKQLQSRVSLFSGVEFTVDSTKGLNGYCDFIISGSKEQLFVSAPVMMLVEAKNDDIKSGLGQCLAEMYAAQLFNQQEGNDIKTIYGTVTTGSIWQFLQLSQSSVVIDQSEYYLSNVNKILGILTNNILVAIFSGNISWRLEQ